MNEDIQCCICDTHAHTSYKHKHAHKYPYTTETASMMTSHPAKHTHSVDRKKKECRNVWEGGNNRTMPNVNRGKREKEMREGHATVITVNSGQSHKLNLRKEKSHAQNPNPKISTSPLYACCNACFGAG